METLSNWELFLHERGRFPDLVQVALMHEQFEAIHPFLDGNGRLGRLLIPLFLIERGRLSQPVLYLSAYFEARRHEYYDALQRVRTDGDWAGWLRFFLAGVDETAREAVIDGIPVRLYPFVAPDISDDRRVITIDPRLAYGRPAIASKGVSTAILTERVNAGESVEELARYYGLDEADVEEAIIYERRAA